MAIVFEKSQRIRLKKKRKNKYGTEKTVCEEEQL